MEIDCCLILLAVVSLPNKTVYALSNILITFGIMIVEVWAHFIIPGRHSVKLGQKPS